LAAIGLTQLSSAFVAGLYDGGVLLNTIWRDAESDLVVGKGDSVTVREPTVIAAANFTGTATATGIAEAKYVIAMSEQPYSQVVLSAKEKTLAVEDLATQVVVPQAAGIAEYIDDAIATKLGTTTGTASGTTADGWGSGALAAREALTTAKVPLADRFLAVSPDVASALLNSTVFQTGNIEGAPSALADGILGRLYGFTVVESAALEADTMIGYHRSAVAGIFRTPVAPEGGALAGSASYRGLSSQIIYAYDSSKLSDVLTCQTLFGLGVSSTSFDERAVKVDLA
jgi:hypothetical protein